MKKAAGILILSFIFMHSVFGAEAITVTVDSGSSYRPTSIVNGSFEDGTNLPSKITTGNGYHPGVGKGWGTTDTGFEASASSGFTMKTYGHSDTAKAADGSYFTEMNANSSAILYQDLNTTPNDVIRWTLAHCTRIGDGWSNPQTMHVEIGKPDGNYPSGVDNSKNTHISSSGKESFYYNRVTPGTYGFATGTDLTNLSMSQAKDTWKTARGVYVIPAGQTVTRFAFISDDTTNPGGGNLLDNVTFSTLIGNLNAYANWDGSIVITGYWGETDSSKKLAIKAGSNVIQVTMSSVTGRNFKITVPGSNIGSATSVDIYHQDYPSASKNIKIERHYHDSTLFGVWNYSTSLPTSGRYALSRDVALSGNVTLSPSSELQICLNGHKITGGTITVSKSLTIHGGFGNETSGSVTSTVSLTGGTLTLNGGNYSTIQVSSTGKLVCESAKRTTITTLTQSAGQASLCNSAITTLTETGGSCLLSDSTVTNATVSASTFTVDKTVTINNLTLNNGQKISIGENLNTASKIVLKSGFTGVITSGLNSITPKLMPGQVIVLEATADKKYLLAKTKSGELQVITHKN